MRIRTARVEDIDDCVALLVTLRDHFTPAIHDQVRASFAASHVVVMEDDGAVVGFAMAERRYPGAAEITYAAVHPTRHREGICSAIVRQVLTDLAEHHGFIQVDCIDPLPGWEAGNPSAIYLKALVPAAASVDR